MKVRSIRNDTFFFDVVLVWPVTPKQLKKFMRDRFDRGFKNPGSFRAICIGRKADGVVIGFSAWSFSNSDLGTLCHETAHATYAMLRARGMKLSDKTEECYCYLHNSLFENCLKAMQK
jgi:hypothetical protein